MGNIYCKYHDFFTGACGSKDSGRDTCPEVIGPCEHFKDEKEEINFGKQIARQPDHTGRLS